MFDNYELNFFNELSEGIIITDKNLRVIFINDSLEVMHHLDRNRCLEKNLFHVYPGLCNKKHSINKTFNERKPSLKTKDVYINYKGEEFMNLNSSYPIFNKNKFEGIINVVLSLKNMETLKYNNIEKEVLDIDKNKLYSSSLNGKYNFIDIIGRSNCILELKNKALKAAKSTSPILIYGETGVGKELFVHSIHNSSLRKNGPLIAQNCAAIPKELFESIMFGTVKGGFTGAQTQKGIFEMANGGTLYLDELNSMPLEFQGKLLRTIQEGTLRKIGDNKEIKVDVRLITSLNEKPEIIIEQGKLREDLYYRLNVIRLDIPPLRERREDIPMLINYFIFKYNKEFHGSIRGIKEKTMEKLVSLNWPGNIRQLQYTIESVFNFKREGIISTSDFPILDEQSNKILSLKDKLEITEKEYIIQELIINDFNISKTSKVLGMPRQTLQYKIKKFNIEIP